MAERQAIFPQISKATSHLLRQTCQTQHCEPGVVVEAALLAFLTPVTPTERDTLLLQGLMRVEKTLQAMTKLLTQIVAELEAQTKPQPIKVASYGELYAASEDAGLSDADEEPTPPAPAAVGRQAGWWGRAFPRRNTP